jgi:hypothetical protein
MSWSSASARTRPAASFVHGLWLLPSSWDRWAKLFEDNGYVALGCGLRGTKPPDIGLRVIHFSAVSQL